MWCKIITNKLLNLAFGCQVSHPARKNISGTKEQQTTKLAGCYLFEVSNSALILASWIALPNVYPESKNEHFSSCDHAV